MSLKSALLSDLTADSINSHSTQIMIKSIILFGNLYSADNKINDTSSLSHIRISLIYAIFMPIFMSHVTVPLPLGVRKINLIIFDIW